MTAFWRILSVISHPLLIVTYAMICMLVSNPFIFGSADLSGQLPYMAIVFFSTFFIPALAVAMMKALNMVNSFELKTRKERVGPLFATCVLYAAFYFNVTRSNTLPPAFINFLFGALISLFMCLFINSFYKISLHAVGMSGLVMGLFIFYFSGSSDSITLVTGTHTWDVNFVLIPIILLIITGLVSSGRLILKAHQLDEIFAGWLLGVAGQVISAVW